MKPTLAVVPARPPSLETLIDEYGELDRQVKLFQPKADRHETLKKLLKAHLNDRAEADKAFTVEGYAWELQVGACAIERKIGSMAKVAKMLGGLKGLLTVCSVPIGTLEDRLGKAAAAGLLVEERTGSRRLKAVPLTIARGPVEAA